MLSFIRDNVQSVAIRFIVGMVALVMLFFGVTNYQDQGINVIASVNGTDIKLDKYQSAYEQQQRVFRQRYQDQAETAMKAAKIPAQIVHSLINSALVIGSAEESGLAISDEELAAEIFSNPSFQTDKRFDLEKYSTLLANNRLDKVTYENDLKNTLLTQKYRNMLATGAAISQIWLRNEYNKYQTEVTAQILEFKLEQFTQPVSLSTEQLKKYYQQNQSDYEQKKMFALKYLLLSKEDHKDKIRIREKEINKYYLKNRDKEFTSKESYKSRHILILTPQDKNPAQMEAAREKAEGVYQKVYNDPSRFTALAKTISDDTGSGAKGGELGWTEKGTLVPEYEKMIKSLDKGMISRPFLSTFGYHIVELQDRRPKLVQPMEDVLDDIKKKIEEKKSTRRLNNSVNKLAKTLAVNTLEDTASELKKEIQESKVFDDSLVLDEIGYSYQLYQKIKNSKIGDKGHHNLSENQGTIIYEIVKVVDAAVKPYETVMGRVKTAAEKAHVDKLASQKLLELQQKTKTKSQFDEVTVDLKLKPEEVVFKITDAQIGSIKDVRKFKSRILDMNAGSVFNFSENGQNLLIYLESKSFKPSDKDNEELEKLEGELRRQKAEVLLQGLVQEKRKSAEIQYNNSMLQALNIRL
ncbi:MAG: hypothetical protein GY786_08405 [Proteobacteria bacterium]|nr:hypothetical protein [Pseudomonadota bacterium]